mmetsp:Transcript_97943/g.174394  ORF Transcript_97943/g.174394 Transcript_97943/m.174394 type:complete len:213 (-) Transcript_97943:39-677(-)
MSSQRACRVAVFLLLACETRAECSASQHDINWEDAESLEEVLEASQQTLLQTFMHLSSPGSGPAGEHVPQENPRRPAEEKADLQAMQKREKELDQEQEMKHQRLVEASLNAALMASVSPLPQAAPTWQDISLSAFSKACTEADVGSRRFWNAFAAVAGLVLLLRLAAKRWNSTGTEVKARPVGSDAWFEHFLQPKRFEPIPRVTKPAPPVVT